MPRNVVLQISQTLNNAEWETLADFCVKVKRLIGTKVVSNDESAISGKVRYTQDHGLLFEVRIPPEEQIAEFLMAFRFFYLEKETTNFYKILSLLGKHDQKPEAREALRILKSQWGNTLFQKTICLSIDNEPVTAALLLDLWFNSHYFHSDKEKGYKLAQLNEAFTERFSKYMLLDSTYNATKLIFTLYNGLNELIITREKSAP